MDDGKVTAVTAHVEVTLTNTSTLRGSTIVCKPRSFETGIYQGASSEGVASRPCAWIRQGGFDNGNILPLLRSKSVTNRG